MTTDLTHWEATAFIAMPFDSVSKTLFTKTLRPALKAHGFEALLAPDLRQTRDVMSKIYKGIWMSRLVVANLDGLNENVLYELGIAAALNKQIIGVTQDVEALPFDLAGDWVIEYKTTRSGLTSLRASLGEEFESVKEEPWSAVPAWKGTDVAEILPVSALVWLESQVKNEVWIIEPREKFQDKVFHSVILANLNRGRQYRFIVAEREDIKQSFKNTLKGHYGVNAHVKYVPQDALPLPIAMALFDACTEDEHGYQYFPNGITAFGVPLSREQLERARQLFMSVWESDDGSIVGKTSIPV
jgi:hypothetical protein